MNLPRCAQALSQHLQDPACQLRSVALKEMNLSGVAVHHLCAGLALNASVEDLDLSSNRLNQLGPRVPQDLRAMLQDNRALRWLGLAYTGAAWRGRGVAGCRDRPAYCP